MALYGFYVAKGYYFDEVNKLSWADVIYYTLQMIPLYGFGPVNPNPPWQLNFARFWLPIVFFSTAIAGVMRLIGRKGLGISRVLLNRHAIICGTGEQAIELVRQYRNKELPQQVLLVAHTDDFPAFDEVRAIGANVLIDDVATVNCWRNAKVSKASAIYLLADEDVINLQTFETLSSEEFHDDLGGRGVSCPCFVHLDDAGLRRWLIQALEGSRRKLPQRLRWIFFSAWENCARDLFLFHGPHVNLQTNKSITSPAMLILGSNALSEQLILQAAKLGHYPGTDKLRVTFVAPDAESVERSINARFPALDQNSMGRWSNEEKSVIPLIDIRYVVSLPESPPFELFSSEGSASIRYQVCFICVDDAIAAVKTIEMLRAQSCDAGHRKPPFRIVLCLPKGASLLGRIAREDEWLDLRRIEADNLTVFNSLAYSCRLEEKESLVREQSEKDAQNIYRFYVGKDDFDWHALAESERDSNRQAADHLKIKKSFLEFSDDQLMRMEHARWCAERLLGGWRYATEKNTVDRLNPNLRAYDYLPESEREKNRSIVNYARELAVKHEIH